MEFWEMVALAKAGKGGGSVPPEQISEAVDDWLEDNVDPETGYVLDSSLTMSNAAAPADKVGDLKSATNHISDILDMHTDAQKIVGTYFNSAFINGNGVITNSSSWRLYYLKISEIEPFSKIVFTSRGTSNSYYQVAFYSTDTPNNNGIILEESIKFAIANSENTVSITNIPETAKCIAFAYLNEYPASIVWHSLEKSKIDTLDALSENIDLRYRDYDITNLLEYFNSAYIDGNGSIVTSPSWRMNTIQMSELREWSKIRVSSIQVSAGRYMVGFYSSKIPSNNTFLGGKLATISGTTNTAEITSIPDGTICIAVTTYIGGGTTELSVVLTSAEPESDVTIATEKIADLENYKGRANKAIFDKQFNYIAYSGFSAAGMGMNTAEHYEWAGQHKYTSIKGDVRISSDNIIVMCHDAGFTIDENNQITTYNSANNVPIRDRTAAEWFAMTYTNGKHPCGIDALIRACKIYGKIAYITVRSDYLDDIFPKIFESLDKYSMRDRAIINGFSYATMKKARKYDSDIMLSWVQNYNYQITTDDVDAAAALGNCLITCYDYSGANPATSANQVDSVLNYAHSKNVRIYEAIMGSESLLTNEMIYDKGITGAQLEFIPSIFQYF